jgi:hypothetical protein
MDWDPIIAGDADEMGWDGGDPPHSASASESGHENGEDGGIQDVAAEDRDGSNEGPYNYSSDEHQHDMADEQHDMANEGQDSAQDRDEGDDEGEEVNGENEGEDEDDEDDKGGDDGYEEYEDEGDEEYEDEGGSHNESLDTGTKDDLGSLDDQSCPVDEDDEDKLLEEHYPEAGRVLQTKRPHFRAVLNEKLQKSDNIYHPFANQREWELGKWMHESGMSVSKMDEFFKLQYVGTSTSLLYRKLTRS